MTILQLYQNQSNAKKIYLVELSCMFVINLITINFQDKVDIRIKFLMLVLFIPITN